MAAPTKSVFHTALQKILDSWTALQYAVQQEFGGGYSKDKAAWMVDATEQWFKENSNLDTWEVEDFLSDILNREFDTVVDDGSCQKIAEAICDCYQLYKAGRNDDMAARLSKLPSCEIALQQSQRQQHTEEDSSSDDDDDKTEGMQIGGASSSQTSPAGGALCGEQRQTAPQPCEQMMNGDMNTPESENKTEDTQMEEDDGWTVVKKHSKKR